MDVPQVSGASWLLILPRPPTELSLHTLKIGYGPALTEALRNASQKTSKTGIRTQLDVGVAYSRESSLSFEKLQSFYALLYNLSSVIYIDLHIDLQYDNDVDIRFFLFADLADNSGDQTRLSEERITMLPGFDSVAHFRKAWTRVCFIQSEPSEGMLRCFQRARSTLYSQGTPQPQITRLPGGLGMLQTIKSPHSTTKADDNTIGQYSFVAVGGTFDHLHAGHKLLLTMTAVLCIPPGVSTGDKRRSLTVGITGDELLKNKKYREHLEDWHQRQRSVRDFLLQFLLLLSPQHVLYNTRSGEIEKSGAKEIIDEIESGITIRYVEIFDPFGPTITDETITALVLSAETRDGGEAVNKKRQEQGWPALDVFEVGVLDGEVSENQSKNAKLQDFQSKLSSTEIRSRIHRKLETRTG